MTPYDWNDEGERRPNVLPVRLTEPEPDYTRRVDGALIRLVLFIAATGMFWGAVAYLVASS